MQIGFKGYSVIAICFLIALLVSVSALAEGSNSGQPEFSIVAPFSGETVSGAMVVLAKPDSPEEITGMKIMLLSDSLPAFEKNFSAEENWALEWDSGTVPDGNYSFEITACSSASCSKKSFISLSITVFRLSS